MLSHKINERPIEYAFTLKQIFQIWLKKILDVGTGQFSLPHLITNCGFRVTAIDEMESYWRKKGINRHYQVIPDDITNPKISEAFDLITCISVLEHIPDHNAAIKGMFRLLRPNGYLILTFPYNEKKFVENVYNLPDVGYKQDASHICYIFSRNEIENWLDENHGNIIEQEFYEIFTGGLWAHGDRLNPPRKVKKEENHHLTCILFQKN